MGSRMVVVLVLLGVLCAGCGLATPTQETKVEPGGTAIVQSGDGNKSVTIQPGSALPPGTKTVTLAQEARGQ